MTKKIMDDHLVKYRDIQQGDHLRFDNVYYEVKRSYEVSPGYNTGGGRDAKWCVRAESSSRHETILYRHPDASTRVWRVRQEPTPPMPDNPTRVLVVDQKGRIWTWSVRTAPFSEVWILHVPDENGGRVEEPWANLHRLYGPLFVYRLEEPS